MRRFTVAMVFAALAASGAPLFAQNVGYLQVGTVSKLLADHSYYVATGEVSLYRVGASGRLIPTGEKTQSAAAVDVDSASGTVLKIVTLQPARSIAAAQGSQSLLNSAAAGSSDALVVSDLAGGIEAIDIQPCATWIAANQAMKQAIDVLAQVTAPPAGGFLDLAPTDVPPVIIQPAPLPVPVIVPSPVWMPPRVWLAPPPRYRPPLAPHFPRRLPPREAGRQLLWPRR